MCRLTWFSVAWPGLVWPVRLHTNPLTKYTDSVAFTVLQSKQVVSSLTYILFCLHPDGVTDSQASNVTGQSVRVEHSVGVPVCTLRSFTWRRVTNIHCSPASTKAGPLKFTILTNFFFLIQNTNLPDFGSYYIWEKKANVYWKKEI